MTEEDRALNNSKAVLLALSAFICFSVADVTRKYMALDYGVYDVLFWQAAIGIGFMLVISPWIGGLSSLYKSKTKRWHALRGMLMAANTAFSMSAIALIPLMDAYTIYFTTPFVLSLLCFVIFKESLGPVRLAMIACGFIGAVIAFRPGFADLGIGYLYASICVFTFSFSSIVVKYAGSGNHLLSYGIYPLSFLLPFTLYMNDWQVVWELSFEFFIIIGLIGIPYVSALVLIAKSYQLGEASIVAPYQYTQIVWAIGFGYFVFAEAPDIYKIIGASVIVCSGVYFFIRERKSKKSAG